MTNERQGRRRVKELGSAFVVLAMALGMGAWTPSTVSAQTRKSTRTATRQRKRAPAMRPVASRPESQVAEAGKRDPFKVPPPPPPGGMAGITGPLPPGKRGLVISQLRLEGIVREDKTNSMIAVVTNATNRAYFLRVNDQVYNGVVSKITPESVYFTENQLEGSGHVSSREVVKRLGSAPGEGR